MLIAQAIGRVGNYFNQELFGGPTELPWGLRIDAAHRPAGCTHFATFLYELLFNLALAAVLIWLIRGYRVRPPGGFAVHVAGLFRVSGSSRSNCAVIPRTTCWECASTSSWPRPSACPR